MKGWVPGGADLVCSSGSARRASWWQRGKLLVPVLLPRIQFEGVRTGLCLIVLLDRAAIFDACSDEPWVVDGAAVRVSLVCFFAG